MTIKHGLDFVGSVRQPQAGFGSVLAENAVKGHSFFLEFDTVAYIIGERAHGVDISMKPVEPCPEWPHCEGAVVFILMGYTM